MRSLILFASLIQSSVLLAAPPARNLKVPEGFSVERVACAPLVDRPVVACFDDKGRLYVADSSGSNEKPEIQLQKKPHRIVRLEDTNGDGIFDKSVVFADQMSFLQGVMWKDGSLYVGAPPCIWKLTDTDGDGIADKREVWFDGKTLTGCANDLHGPYDGPDGFIYWTKGAFARQTIPKEEKGTKCAMILRAKPDGSQREVVMTGGMDNPVDVVFLPNGERIFSTTFFQHPANGQRDGLVHAVIGAVYGKDHDPVYERPWTSTELMPPMTHMGPAAPSGLHRYSRDQLGAEYTGNLFCAQFNMRQVSRHILVPSGSTYVTKDSPFVWSDDMDFHPTDVIEDADGSLIVIDTGGWYKLCCPSSQLVKPDVLGGIYRVKKIGSHKTKSIPAPLPLSDLYRVSLNRDAKGFGLAVKSLRDEDRQVRRLAAEALGRIGDKRAVPYLFKALEEKRNDRFLNHSLTYAMIEIGDSEAILQALDPYEVYSKLPNNGVLFGQLATELKPPHHEHVIEHALYAIGGIGGDQLGKQLKPFLKQSYPSLYLQSTAWLIAKRHPELADQWIDIFEIAIQTNGNSRHGGYDGGSSRYFGWRMMKKERYIMTRYFLNQNSVQELVLAKMQTGSIGSSVSQNAFQIATKWEKGPLPKSWENWFAEVLKDPKHQKLFDVLDLLFELKTRKIPISESIANLAEPYAQDDREQVRNFAKWIVPAKRLTLPDRDIQDVLAKNQPLTVLESSFRQFKVTDQAFQLVIDRLPSLSMMEVRSTLILFEQISSEPVGLALVKTLNTPEMRAKIRTEQIKPILDKYPAAVKAEAVKLYAELDKARGNETEKLLALIKEMPKGEVRRGQELFNTAKANCKACHTIGYVGGKIGPDLTRIGSIRSEQDLLESIVFPSSSFVRSYEPMRIELKDGRSLNGNIKSESNDSIVLTIAADQELTISRGEIESMKPGTVSVMPAGFDQQLTKQDLADLVAFLKASK